MDIPFSRETVCDATRRSIFLFTWAFRAVNKHDIVRTRPTFSLCKVGLYAGSPAASM